MKVRFILFVALIMVTSKINSQDHKLLLNKWYLDKYLINNNFYQPEENETDDYLLLLSDSTYESVDEGKYEEGRWSYLQNEETIVIYNYTKNDSILFKITKLTEDELVYMVDLKLGFDIIIFMKSTR